MEAMVEGQSGGRFEDPAMAASTSSAPAAADPFDDRPRFEGFQFIGFLSFQKLSLVPLPDDEISASSLVARDDACAHVLLKASSPKKVRGSRLRILDPWKGVELLPPPEANEDSLLLESCRQVLNSHWLFFARASYENTGEASVRMDVYLSADLWKHRRELAFDSKSNMKRLFLRLQGRHGRDEVEDRADDILARARRDVGEKGILASVFTKLPRHTDLVSRNFLIGQQSNVLPDVYDKPGLWVLPTSALHKIVQHLDSSSLGNLAATCRHLHSVCCIQVPGLKLQLYQHQKTALFWMLGREGNQQAVSLSPGSREHKTGDGFGFWVDLFDGKVTFEAPDSHPDCRGGFLCDEPGMGKTVTAISLILRTKSLLPRPPHGCHPVFSCEGSKQGLYETEKRGPGGLRMNEDVVTKNRRSRRNRKSVQPWSAPPAPSAPSTQAGGKAEAEAEAAMAPSAGDGQQRELPDKPVNWVQCDACKKWRVVGESMSLATSVQWLCKMSDDPELQRLGCEVPEDAAGAASGSVAIKSLGFIRMEGGAGRPTRQGQSAKFEEDNVQFFISVLKTRKDLWKNVASAVNFLSTHWDCQRQLKSPGGIQVPSGRREPEDYGMYFEKIGLSRLSASTPHTWVQPKWVGEGLAFDHEALKFAIRDLSQFQIEVERVFLSCATLVVVPAHLVQQWCSQLDKCCEEGELRIHVFDERDKELEAHELAWNFDVVITTFNVLSVEWTVRAENSSLMRVHWLRMILDEGHSLGSSLGITNKLQMACCIKAERRWIMTGTPTPDTVAQGAAHLLPLLKFLHEPQFGLQPTMWQPVVQRPLEAGREEGARSLVKCLSRLMIHAQKADLESIPPCRRVTKTLKFDPKHARNYNEFVAVVQRNLLLADWWDENHHESLMHSSKIREMMQVVRNVRLSCNLSGHMMMDPYEQDIRETMMIVTQMRPAIDPAKLAWIEGCLRFGGKCERCGEYCRVPVVTPRCVHVLCVDCAGLSRWHCPLCSKPYQMERAQFPKEGEEPKMVPVELIELQPSYAQGRMETGASFAPNWIKTTTAKSRHVLRALEESPKLIVFSQFQEHLRMVEDAIEPGKCVGLYSSSSVLTAKKMRVLRAEALKKFENDDSCRVLLMDGICSHGLDLSFCSRVVILEPIWDPSLEEQVVSRAHRMGQRMAVLVETLAMEGTTEEVETAAREGPDSGKAKAAQSDYLLTKSRILLNGLRAVAGVAGPEETGGVEPASASAGAANGAAPEVLDLAREALMSSPAAGDGERDGGGQEEAPPPSKKQKRRVMFAEPLADEKPSEDFLLLSAVLQKYEDVKGLGLGAVECQLREERREVLARIYFLLCSAWWTPNRVAKDIYLMEKDLHPRLRDPKVFEVAKELPGWYCGMIRNLLCPM